VRRKLLRTPAARRDLVGIWTYIADDSESAADRLLDRFEAVFTMLVDNPLAGRPRTELHPNLRSVTVGEYVLFY
jgi:toxin ParE1/3/4